MKYATIHYHNYLELEQLLSADYLKKTAEQHAIFADFHNLSTLLIPLGLA